MGLISLEFVPGIDSVSSILENKSSFSDGSLVRFFKGARDRQAYLQKRGGWTQLSMDHVVGTVRGMHAFFDLDSNGYFGFGSEQALQLFNVDTIYDITPIEATSDLATPLSTTLGSSIVTVTDVSRTPNVGDWIYISTLCYVGGLVLQGRYQVTNIPGANQYQFDAGVNATSNVAAGGTTLAFSTLLGSPIVTFSLGAATFTVGDVILVYLSTTVGGLTFSGNETVLAGGVTFNPGVGNASSGAGPVSENGGNVQVLYLLPSLLDANSVYTYGTGPYGAGPYGAGAGLPVGGQYQVRQWSIDNFGQIMVAAPFHGPIYEWTPPITYDNRAVIVPVAPQFSTDLFVAMPEEQVVSLGSDSGTALDPLLVRFSDIGDFVGAGSWTASATNQAGSFRLTKGARIIGGLQGDQQGYIWTDEGMWLMSYIGFPLVYSFTQVGHGCGLVAKRAAALVGGRLMWCGHAGFWEWVNGGVVPVPCSVWDYLFGNLDFPWTNDLHAFPNSDFNEIEWYFPPVGTTGVPTRYVSYNLTTNVWSQGIKTITSGVDRSDVAAPTGADVANGLLLQHEVASDANGEPMASFADTHWFTVGVGADEAFVERLIHDFVYGTPASSVLITVFTADFPNAGENPDNANDAPRSFGPFTASGASQWIICRARGALIKLRFDFSPLGSFARLGAMRAVASPSGRKR